MKWIVPLHTEQISAVMTSAKKTILIENNESGQFARYLRGETGLNPSGHIRKYDGEPFMPHHIVNGVLDHLEHNTPTYVPYQEVVV